MQADKDSVFSIKNLTFSHGKTEILKGISLTINKGSFYGLVGPNGSGKTTFLDLLSARYQPQNGTIHFHDQPIASFPNTSLAKHLAFVPQEFGLGFDFSVFDIVLMGRHPHIPRFSNPTERDLFIVEKSLKQMDIFKLKNRLVTELSGGEKQRVIVARALAQDTEVLILDEATSNLDINHTLQIMNVLRKKTLSTGATVIAAIHDLNIAASFCDELIILKDGSLYDKGDVSELVTEKLIQDVFSVESSIIRDTPQSSPRIFYNLN